MFGAGYEEAEVWAVMADPASGISERGLEKGRPRAATTSGQRTGRLTALEQEVAHLAGRGLTNRQIAQELSISERTAENHVGRILK
jgi:DNA-binding NarL/FixJ family response regulator